MSDATSRSLKEEYLGTSRLKTPTTPLAVRAASAGICNATGAVYPAALRGTWDLAPHPCRPDKLSDSDMRVVIGVDTRNNYEERDTIVAVRPVAGHLPAWRIDETSDLDPKSAPDIRRSTNSVATR